MREYKSVYPELKDIVTHVRDNDLPVYVCNIQTTGLDPRKDRIIQFSSIKCKLTDNELVETDCYTTFINPEMDISEFTKNFTGHDNDFYKNQKTLAELMPEIRDFTGNSPVVLGWTANGFLSPFLMNAGFETGYMVYPSISIDLMKIVQSVVPLLYSSDNYTFRSIAERYNIEILGKSGGHDARHDVAAYIKIFNKIYHLSITGHETATVKTAHYWEKSSTNRALYFETNFGDVHINANTNFFVEDTPGLFDKVDMDQFSEYILEKANVSKIEDLVKIYYKNFKKKVSV